MLVERQIIGISVIVPASKHSEKQIVKAINDGDKATFERLFFRYYTDLCLAAFRIVESEEAAKDIVQSIFLKLWKARKKLRINTSLEAYIFKAVKNQALNHIKKQRNRSKVIRNYTTEIEEDLKYNISEPDRPRQNLTVQIWQIVEKMPTKRRAVFTYHRRYGLSYQEIAEVLNISRKTVENHMGLALKYLRNEIERDSRQ